MSHCTNNLLFTQASQVILLIFAIRTQLFNIFVCFDFSEHTPSIWNASTRLETDWILIGSQIKTNICARFEFTRHATSFCSETVLPIFPSDCSKIGMQVRTIWISYNVFTEKTHQFNKSFNGTVRVQI